MSGREPDTRSDEQKRFDEATQALHGDLKALAEKYDVAVLTAIHFNKENLHGVHYYGTKNAMIPMGLAKLVKDTYEL